MKPIHQLKPMEFGGEARQAFLTGMHYVSINQNGKAHDSFERALRLGYKYASIMIQELNFTGPPKLQAESVARDKYNEWIVRDLMQYCRASSRGECGSVRSGECGSARHGVANGIAAEYALLIALYYRRKKFRGDTEYDPNRTARYAYKWVTWCTWAANAGNHIAQMYMVKHNTSKRYWMVSPNQVFYAVLASEQGNAHAMSELSWMYEYGLHISQDITLANKYLHAAADAGDSLAAARLGDRYAHGGQTNAFQPDAKLAMHYLNMALKLGEGLAYNSMAYYHLHGCDFLGIKRDTRLAMQYSEIAASYGYGSTAADLYKRGMPVRNSRLSELYDSGKYYMGMWH